MLEVLVHPTALYTLPDSFVQFKAVLSVAYLKCYLSTNYTTRGEYDNLKANRFQTTGLHALILFA